MDIKYLIKNKLLIYKLNQSISVKIIRIHGVGFTFGFLCFSLIFLCLFFIFELAGFLNLQFPLLAIYFIYIAYSFIFPLKRMKNKFLKDKPSYFKNIYTSLEVRRGFLTYPKKIHHYINELESEFTEEELKILEHKDIGEYTKLIYNSHKEKLVQEIYQYIKDNKISKKEKKDIDLLIKYFKLDIDKDKYDLLLYKNDNDSKKNNITNVNKKILIKDI